MQDIIGKKQEKSLTLSTKYSKRIRNRKYVIELIYQIVIINLHIKIE